VSQAGTNVSRFQLQYRADANGGTGGFCFTMRTADSAAAAAVSACTTQNVWPVTEGDWVHLAGTYNPITGKIRVYVMGDQLFCPGDMAEADFSSTWSATGSLVLGRSNNGAGGTAADWLTGDLDTVYAYQRVLNDLEVCELAQL
jgi:hypothetical protein